MSVRKWFASSDLTPKQRFFRIAFVFCIGLFGVIGTTAAILMDVAGEDKQAQACLAFMFLCSAGVSFLAVFTAITVALQLWLEKKIAEMKEKPSANAEDSTS